MELCGTGLCLHRNCNALRPPVLGVKRALKHAELTQRIDARLRVLRLIVTDVNIRRAIQVEVIFGSAPTEAMEL